MKISTLIVVAGVFIAFALASSFLVPRYKPDFPGPAGLSVFAIASMADDIVLAVNIPPHAPAPGQARRSTSSRSASESLRALYCPTASNALTTVSAWSR